MKTLLILLALGGPANADTAAVPKEAPAVAPKIDPQWKVNLDATPEQRIKALLPPPGEAFGPRRNNDDDLLPVPAVTRPPAGPTSYLGGLVTVDEKGDGKKDVRADITAIVLPQSPSGTLTVGQILHEKAPTGFEDVNQAELQNQNRFAKGPKAVAAVTLKIHF
jgi:hypothetical protein